ncbi:hypothetical protein BRADI_5g18373v3, partial [Brachypodium distachyon]
NQTNSRPSPSSCPIPLLAIPVVAPRCGPAAATRRVPTSTPLPRAATPPPPGVIRAAASRCDPAAATRRIPNGGENQSEIPAPAGSSLPIPDKGVVSEEDGKDGEVERLEPKWRRASVAALYAILARGGGGGRRG